MNFLKKHKIFSEILIFSSSNYISSLMACVASFVIRRVLGPLTMGQYSELMLFWQYGKLHHLGIINSLEREIPFWIGKKDNEKVQSMTSLAFYFILFTSFNLAVLFLIISYFLKDYAIGLYLLIPIIFLETLISFYQTLIQSVQRFNRWSLFILIEGIVDTGSKVLFVSLGGLNGLLWSMVLTALVTLTLYYRWGKTPISLKFNLDWGQMRSLLNLGLPLIFYRLLYTVATSMDRLVIIFFMGRLSLGYYSIATMVWNYLTLVPKFSFKTLSPRLMDTLGKTGDVQELKKYVILPNILFGRVFSILIGLLILWIPWVIHTLLPKFTDGIQVAQLVTIAAFFSAFIYTWNMLLMAVYRQNVMVGLYGLNAILTLAINVICIGLFGKNLMSVAIASIFSQMLFTSILMVYGNRFFTREIKNHVRVIVDIFFPVIWLGLAMWLATNSKLVPTLYTSCLFLVSAIPLCVYTFQDQRFRPYLQFLEWRRP